MNTRMNVTIDDGPIFPAEVDPTNLWNGWLSPGFDRQTAERVVDWTNREATRYPDSDRARWDGDTIVITNPVYPGEWIVVAPDSDGLYWIGAWSWCWTEAPDPERYCRDFASKYPTPNVKRGIELAEQDRITWTQLDGIFKDALR